MNYPLQAWQRKSAFRKQYKEILAYAQKLQKSARYHVVITLLSQIDVDDLPVKFMFAAEIAL